MTLNVQEALEHINHTLSTKGTHAFGMRILNDAGEYLCTCHHWKWLERPRHNLHFEADQGYVWLPRDFRDLIAYDATQGLTSGLSLTTHQYLVELRTSAITTSTWRYWGAITHAPRQERPTGTLTFSSVPDDGDSFTLDDGVNAPIEFEFDSAGDGTSGSGVTEIDTSASGLTSAQVAALVQTAIESVRLTGPLDIDAVVDADSASVVNLTNRRHGTIGNITITDASSGLAVTGMSGGRDGGRPEPRIDIWPDPTADLENALTIYYRAGWTHLNVDDVDVAIPEWLETVYIQLVRAHARGYEREDRGSMSMRVEEIYRSPHMRAAMERDAEMQPDYGPMQGGAAEVVRDNFYQFWNFGSVSAPS